jgi:hypothetical protein
MTSGPFFDKRYPSGASKNAVPYSLTWLFSVPVSFFKSISIIFGSTGLIFEGLRNPGGCRNGKFCKGLSGVNPQRSNQDRLRRDLFWEMLFQKDTGTALGSGPSAWGLGQ